MLYCLLRKDKQPYFHTQMPRGYCVCVCVCAFICTCVANTVPICVTQCSTCSALRPVLRSHCARWTRAVAVLVGAIQRRHNRCRAERRSEGARLRREWLHTPTVSHSCYFSLTDGNVLQTVTKMISIGNENHGAGVWFALN